MLFAAPSVLKEPTDRLVRYSENIEKQAPYSIEVLNENMEVIMNEDFELMIKLSGDEIPERVYVLEEGRQFRLEKGDNNVYFSHTFHNVKSDKSFQFLADGFYSKEYDLTAIPAPSLLNFEVDLDYPAYTGYKDESLSNTGDLLVPEGTIAEWLFETEHTNRLNVRFPDSTFNLNPESQNIYRFSKRAFSNVNYSILPENERIKDRDSIVYQIQVIKDRHPVISVVESMDSTSDKQYYFTGEVGDDYGFRRLTFQLQG